MINLLEDSKLDHLKRHDESGPSEPNRNQIIIKIKPHGQSFKASWNKNLTLKQSKNAAVIRDRSLDTLPGYVYQLAWFRLRFCTFFLND